jgi:hypothetical protein
MPFFSSASAFCRNGATFIACAAVTGSAASSAASIHFFFIDPGPSLLVRRKGAPGR